MTYTAAPLDTKSLRKTRTGSEAIVRGTGGDLTGDPQSSGPIRILVPFNTPHLYGMERAVVELFHTMRPEVEPHFVTAESFKRARLPVIAELERLGLEHSFLPDGDGGWPGLGRPKSAGQVVKLLWTTALGNALVLRKGWSADAIYIPSPKYVMAWMAARWGRARGKPVIYHCHDLRPPRAALRLWYPLISDYVFSSEAARQEFTGYVPRTLRARTSVIPHILNIPEEGTQPAEDRIIFVGQVSRHKGIDLLIRAFMQLAPRFKSTELHLIGGVADAFKAELNALISQSGCSDRIHVWGFRSDSREILRTGSIYVQPSPPSRFLESHPMAVLEAMASGLPVVCFPSGGLREMVEHRVSGLICEEESAECLAQAIGTLLGNPEERRRLADGSRRRYRTEYSPETVRSRWLDFLKVVAKR